VRARIQNISQKTDLKSDILYQRYLLERFIARMAASEHSESIVIKGGMLISAMTGINMRATKDLDATIIGNQLTMQDFEKIAHDVIAVNLDDNIHYEFVRTEEILQDNNYPCCRVHLRALLGKMNAKIEIDLTSGDAITPKEIDFGFPSLFGDEEIKILAYNLETILAEKMTAILDLSVFNTRAKDFYDIYLLANTLSDKFDNSVWQDAFHNTVARRKKENLLPNIQETVVQILENQDIRKHWAKYRAEYVYAADIEFEQIEAALLKLFEWAGHKIEKSVGGD
jgi:predicted nucleotidyltransferase component of viral defense system